MAGSNPGFDASAFRTGIRFVYDMAAPPVEGERAIFYFPSQLVYNAAIDGEDVPFDPQATVQRLPPRVVTDVPCGVEYFDAQGQEIVFGTVTASRIAITLLDEDHSQVKGCAYVTIGGDKYLFKRTETPSGLFDVGLYTMHFTSENET
jgi:hypothetical protein